MEVKKRSLKSLCSSRSNGNWFSYCGVFISFLSRFLSYSFDIDKNPFVHGDMIFYSVKRQHDDDEAICGEWSIKMQINDGESFSKSSIHFIRIIMRCLRRKTRLTTEWERNKWTWDMRAAVNLLLVYETHQIQCWMIWIIRRGAWSWAYQREWKLKYHKNETLFIFLFLARWAFLLHSLLIFKNALEGESRYDEGALCRRKEKGVRIWEIYFSRRRDIKSLQWYILFTRIEGIVRDWMTSTLDVCMLLFAFRFSFSFSNYNDDTQTMSRFRFTDKLILTTVDCLPSAMIMTRFCYCDSKNAHIKFCRR